jgi:hypothetical protein
MTPTTDVFVASSLNSDVIAQNMVGIDMANTMRLVMPVGKSHDFTIDGNDEAMKIPFLCVIIASKRMRYYFKEDYNKTNSREADCISYDTLVGHPRKNPDIQLECISCLKNQYGSGNGRAKACKERIWLVLVIANKLVPFQVSLPPTSLKTFNTYMINLSRKNERYHTVATEIRLSTNEKGHTVVYFSFVRRLSETEQSYINDIFTTFQNIDISDNDEA